MSDMITEIQGQVCEMYFGLGMQIIEIAKKLNIHPNTAGYAVSKYMYHAQGQTEIITIQSKANFTEVELIQMEAEKMQFIKVERNRKHKARRHIYYANQKKYRLAKARLGNI